MSRIICQYLPIHFNTARTRVMLSSGLNKQFTTFHLNRILNLFLVN